MTTKIPYSKSYTEESSLIALLQSRGLSITDESKAQHYLTHIGYYRLSAYMYPLLCTPKEQHIYKKGTTFDKVMMLYRFDKKLRLLLFKGVMGTGTEVNPQSWTQHLLFICEEEH